MIKRDVKYKNPFTGEDIEETLYFNINLAEAIKMEMYEDLSGNLTKMGNHTELEMGDPEAKKSVFSFFERLVEVAWGVKSEDGINFVKDPEKTRRFMTSEAYSALLEWLLLSDNAAENAAEFTNGLFPPAMMKKAVELAEEEKKKESGEENQIEA